MRGFRGLFDYGLVGIGVMGVCGDGEGWRLCLEDTVKFLFE